ncbi:MAG TPA: mRNA surveillance protein pelota [Methanospirillum sp.]|uniref:mRNA surveillance protein pelota n=1 Tax=Methanospirillum sp. TaxID=45200 RepID=UPI002C74E354|nr:mRNA surveillance protein pelota [Methanospirillum sp.]HWQ63496.1 mRNA surveillance protein pelota [Methanospirillum sp.]
MKADIGEMQRSFGEIKLFPESSDDLWHLKHLVIPGCLVFATTLRSVEGATDKIRPEKQEKRPVRLGIRVEQVEFHEYAIRLRVFGLIEQGVDEGSHHTLNLEPGYEISVIRTWFQTDLDRIDRAVKSAGAEAVHILAIEEGDAELYRMHSYGPRQIFSLTAGSGKGMECSTRQDLYDAVIAVLEPVIGPLVIAGPGFIKEDFARRLKALQPNRAGALLVIETRRSGRGAVQEVIGQGVLEKLTGDLQLAREVRFLDELMARIAKGEPVAYGMQEVSDGVKFGATETLLIADTGLHNPDVTALVSEAEAMRADVVILSTEFEPGQRLEKLGGVAALLRYPIS